MKLLNRKARWLTPLGFTALAFTAIASEPKPADAKPASEQREPSLGARVLEAVLPTSMQKRPTLRFNVITEMTDEGRKRKQPTAESPSYYLMHQAKFVQTGWSVSAGERPPPIEELEAGMRKALAGNSYLPVPNADQRPELLIILNFGSHGTDPAQTVPLEEETPVTAAELVRAVVSDIALFKDVIARATLVAGEKFSRDLKAALDHEVRNIKQNQMMARNGNPILLPVSPEGGSPFQVFVATSKNSAVIDHLTEMAFHTCYFVLASAYDFESAQSNQKRLLWRTKMTVQAQGVTMAETLGPLITNVGPYLGREMTEAIVVKKRIDREGKVQMGTPTVVEGVVPNSPPDKSSKP